jgi:phosphatidylglycerophosphate synthase
VAAATGSFAASASIILASGLLDALDGIVARATGRESRFGALLDSTVDRLSDGLPLVGVTVFYATSGGGAVAIPVLAMMGAFTVSYIRARTEALGGTLPPLFMRRAERLALLVVAFLLAPFGASWMPFPSPLVLAGVGLLGTFNFVGVVTAMRSARHALVGPRSVSVAEPSE